jgi:hypothetical protein
VGMGVGRDEWGCGAVLGGDARSVKVRRGGSRSTGWGGWCRDQPSALAVGSCWDRPSAFAVIGRQLLPSALAGIDRRLLLGSTAR